MIVVVAARAVYAQGPSLSPHVSILVIFIAGFVLSAAAATLLWWFAERPYFAWVRNARPA
jgi:peptidoglycan/LPS O-acetylase OafA/YrhL